MPIGDDAIILAGLVLLASSPFCLALLLRWHFPAVNHKLVCHLLSGAYLLFLFIGYAVALRAYRLAGNQDDGSSSMAAFFLATTAAITIPGNLLIYLRRPRKRT